MNDTDEPKVSRTKEISEVISDALIAYGFDMKIYQVSESRYHVHVVDSKTLLRYLVDVMHG